MHSWFPLWCALSLNVSGKKKHWKRCVCIKKRHRVEITWRLQRSTLNCRLGESSYKRDRVFPVNAKKQSSFSLFSQGMRRANNVPSAQIRCPVFSVIINSWTVVIYCHYFGSTDHFFAIQRRSYKSNSAVSASVEIKVIVGVWNEEWKIG